MDKDYKKRKKQLLITIILIIEVIQITVLVYIAKVKRENKYQDANIYAQSLADSIQLTLENSLKASETLKYFYSNYGEAFFNDFESIASAICEDNYAIGSLYIAPKGVIEVAYPEEINESTIGFKMLEDEEQGPRAQLAIDTKKITVAGPHELIEGGIGFIIRNPIFEGEDFVGFTIVVLDWNKFVEQVKENTISTSTKYKFAIWKDDYDEHAVTDSDGFIIRNTEQNISKKLDIEINVPNDVWHLIVEPTDGWKVGKNMIWDIIISHVISIGIILLVYSFLLSEERKRSLQKEIDANEAKSEFLSRMSHDIRTPLNGIIGLIELNEKHADDRQYVDENRQKAKVAANYLHSLIGDVLELSKMEAKEVELVEEPFSFLELAKDVLTISSLRAEENGISLNYEDFTNTIKYPYVYGSPLHVRQILLNIIGNAVKYNKTNGSVSCSAKTTKYDGEIVTYEITISDTGIGMSEKFMEHMFDPFSQEHNDARSTYQGTGLGMTIVKALLDKMNGTISVSSKMNIGSTFVVSIPFRVASKEAVPVHVIPEKMELKGINILLVEDNELNMEIAEAVLSDLGANITKAFNGEEAVNIFKNNAIGSFDIILMDLMMPVLDGYGATKAIREYNREDANSIPIVAMTANAFVEDVQKCIITGMNGHIAKPIKVEELMKTLSEVIR